MAGPRHALTRMPKGQKIKDQGHAVITRAAGVGMHVHMTA